MIHKCLNCQLEFKYKSELERHMNRKIKCSNEPKIDYRFEPIRCNHCGKDYSTKFNLERHYKTCKIKNKKVDVVKDVVKDAVIITENQTKDKQQVNSKPKTNGIVPMSLDYILQGNDDVNIEQTNNLKNNNTETNNSNNVNTTASNNNTNNTNSHNNVNITMPNFIHPFGYEDITFLSDDAKLEILTNRQAIMQALKAMYSQPQNCNIYRPNANKDHISMLIAKKETKIIKSEPPEKPKQKQTDYNSDDDVTIAIVSKPKAKENKDVKESLSNLDLNKSSDKNDNNLEDESILEPRQVESSFESEISSCSDVEEYHKKVEFINKYGKKPTKIRNRSKQRRQEPNEDDDDHEDNKNADKVEENISDILIQSKNLAKAQDMIISNAIKYLERLLHSCKYKLNCEDQLCIIENIEENSSNMSIDFFIENILDIIETQFSDKLCKEIFKNYEKHIRFSTEFKTDKISAMKQLLKDLIRFLNDRGQVTIDNDFLDTQIWSEEIERNQDTNPSDEFNNLNKYHFEHTPRYRFFEDMKELEYKYFSEHGISIGNLYKYKKLLLERAKKEIERIEEAYNNKKLKEEVIGKLIDDNKYTLARRLQQIKFRDPTSLVPGLDTNKFAKLTFDINQIIPECLINYRNYVR